MHILLTGANGYIGKRLLPALLDAGHTVTCSVRDAKRFHYGEGDIPNLEVVEIDFLDMPAFDSLPSAFDAAYYLIHSMNASIEDFDKLERMAAVNFRAYAEYCGIRQVIYLGGIANAEQLSRHLASRKSVERVLWEGQFACTVLRAGIIIGSGSASFEIIRDLVEKLPVMITPRWVLTKTQPIAVANVIEFLHRVLGREDCLQKDFDIGGPDILSYKEMLLQFAAVRGLKRYIITIPFLTPRLSSYWLFFVTSTSYKLAVNLVNSMKVEVIGVPNTLHDRLGITLVSYKDAVKQAFTMIESRYVRSSWKDAISASPLESNLMQHVEVPRHGCFIDRRSRKITTSRDEVLRKLWAIGGDTGWYALDWLWEIRGFVDKLFGGSGLRRGRTDPVKIHPGDALDFWRVLVADRDEQRLLLYAEMKLPGEAWLEFRINAEGGDPVLVQTATFRPRGVWGRLYWYLVSPFHALVFRGLLKRLTN